MYLTDMNKLDDRKMENQNENNINETEMIANMNEDANKIDNSEVNHATEKKDVEYNHIQFENVLIKIEQEDQFLEENFDKPVVNQNEIKSVVNQNDINLMDKTLKKENENQDFKEHLLDKFDNISETFDTKNDDMKIKVEKNYDYSSYSEIYPYDPLTNLDEIKIDIVNNEIESINVEKSINYKSEDIEESLDHVIPLQDEDETDRDASSCLIKDASTDKLLKLQDKDNQKVKKIRGHKVINPGSKKLECNICDKKYSVLTNLRYHMRIHTGEKPYECSVCQKKFTQSSYLREHMRIHTGEKPFECSICHKKFTQLSNLREHMRIHTGEKPYECSVCQKKFTQSSTLKEHKKIHTGEKPHQCSVCQKKFMRPVNLSAHMKCHTLKIKANVVQKVQRKDCEEPVEESVDHIMIHTEEKSNECNVCQKKFTQSSSLRAHLKIHSGEKPYECSVCQKKFTRSYSLREHMRIHTGEKPHQCSVCQKKFTQLYHMKHHINKSHMKCHTLKIKSNVVQNLHRKNCEEVEESVDDLLVSEDESEIDGSQNNVKLTVSALKKENKHLDSEEHSQESFKNILKTCTSNDKETKVEEIYDYPLYLEKSPDDPLMNLDEIKLDIVDNDIDSVNTEIYVPYKSEDMENI